jgi:type II secretory pathway component PulK
MTQPAKNLRPAPRRGGTVLIVTMWVVLVLASLVLVLARTMQVEAVCSANGLSAAQADAIQQGAVQYVLAHTAGLQGKLPTDIDMPCEAVAVGQGAFWIIKPNYDNEREFAYGLVDESSKLNLNYSSTNSLMKLPDMTEEFAIAIADWHSPTTDPSPGGAKSEYYQLLPDPYQCKNSPFETVEELFLVKSATTSILYGEDINRNGMLDPNEDDGDVSDPADNRDGKLDRGIVPFVTVYSVEPNLTIDGNARVNVNMDVVNTGTRGTRSTSAPAATLRDLLGKSMSAGRADQVTALARTRRPFTSALDFAARMGLTTAEFAPIADSLTAQPAGSLRGLINVNTAPREVLACLPGLDDSDVDALIAQRTQSATDTTNIAWVLQALKPDKARAIGSSITARTYRYSADIVSVSGDGRAFRRCRIIVDAQTTTPKVIFRQDLTHLGWPLDEQIMTRLRAGGSVAEFAPTQTIRQEGNR